MPVLAIHHRTGTGLSPQQDTSSTASAAQMTPDSGKPKRFGLLRHLKPGNKNTSNSTTESATTISPTPIKRATAPPESPGKLRPSTPRRKDRARSVSPRSPEPNRSSNDAGRTDSARDTTSRPINGFVSSRPMSNGSTQSYTSVSSSDQHARSSSKPGIRWAAAVENDPSRPRARRQSSGATSKRRSSIYFRTADGDHVEGVDQGAGSKARRLSVQLPREIQVDEDRLEDFFDLLSRLGKKKIGEGGAASVQLMKSKKAGDDQHKVFAVKEFRPWDNEEEEMLEYKRKIKSEYAIAKSCQHPNIVHTFRLCTSSDEWFHVMEYCDLGDLNDLINKDYFNQEDRNCMFKQLLRGVDYLHSRGIAHRDLKSENLLVNHFGCLKIADFGTSEVFCGEHPGARNCRRPSIIGEDQEVRFCTPGMIGSKPYMAPELVERKHPYDPRGIDVWSCAIVYLSLCFNGTPWESASAEANNYNIFCNSWDDWLERHPHGLIKLDGPLPTIASSKIFRLDTPGARPMVLGMLHPDPCKRWKVKDALEVVCNREGAGPWPCCQQEGYSDDIKLRERKARHNHIPPDRRKRNGEFAGK